MESLRKKRALMFIRAAIEEHQRFEADHQALMRDRLIRSRLVDDAYRTVKEGEVVRLIRPFGQYDRDQKVDRILGEVLRKYRFPPRNLRAWVEEALG